MVDSARQLLDELMGRNRNLDPTSLKAKQVHWEDPDFCIYYLVKFCPHDLFVNTRADLGLCSKLHDDEAKRLYEEARPSIKKKYYEDEFLRFCSNMINEVDRKIQKGKNRLLLMSKNAENGTAPVSKHQEQINILNDRIKKLVGEAEEAGIRGDVEQAQGLMKLCDKLKEEKEALQKTKDNHWSVELAQAQEKQMEVCEVCGAFLIVGDAQQRIDDHLTGKQHLGYTRLRKAVEDMYEARRNKKDDDDKRRDFDRRNENGIDKYNRRFDDRDRFRRNRDDYDDRRRREERFASGSDRRDNRHRERPEFRESERERHSRERTEKDPSRHRYRGERESKRRSRSRDH